jgi:hypothetical protein
VSVFPIARYLVPMPAMSELPEYTVIDQPLTSGLPTAFALTEELTLVVGFPTGLAQTWREADVQAIVSTSQDEWLAFEAPEGPAEAMRASVRLVLIRSGAIVATAPALAGVRVLMPAGGEAALGTLIEISMTAWLIHAGTVIGPGDFGSRIRLGWRKADVAVDTFMPPPVRPGVASRLKRARAPQSELGTGVKRVPEGYGIPFRFLLVDELPPALLPLLVDEPLPNVFASTGTPSNWELA